MAATTRTPIGAPYSIQPSTSAGFTLFSLDATNDAIEWIVQAQVADTITHVGFRYGVRTGTPPTYRISIQGVGTDGNPDGTIKGGGSPASATFTPPASTAWNSTWQWVALSNSYVVSRGEKLAIVIDYSSGTIDVSNFGSFTSATAGTGGRQQYPYVIENNATVRARAVAAPAWGMKSSTASYGAPFQSTTTVTFSSSSNPNERGMAFMLPAGSGDTFQIAGIRAVITTPAAATTFDVRLYEGTTLRQTATFDSDHMRANGFTGGFAEFFFADVTLWSCAYGTIYYIVFAPNEATTVIGLTAWTAVDAQDAAAWGGDGNWYSATRNGGAWTTDTFTRPTMEVLLADMSEPIAPPSARQLLATRASTY
jgi:hypothetical protein